MAVRGARHNEIDHAVIAQVFSTLKPIGELFMDRLLDHPSPGEADYGAGFRKGDVANHRERGGNPSGRRIGQ